MVVDVQGIEFGRYFDECRWNENKGDGFHDSRLQRKESSPRPVHWRHSHRRKGPLRKQSEVT